MGQQPKTNTDVEYLKNIKYERGNLLKMFDSSLAISVDVNCWKNHVERQKFDRFETNDDKIDNGKKQKA